MSSGSLALPLQLGFGLGAALPSREKAASSHFGGTLRRKAGELRDDQRGAVMMTGLFMAFFLIGALWYVIGIGDAIIFRDRMQEAADHAAFTSAALHAKGMNFIAACNLVMLILIAVHIVLGIIHDIALAACILSLGVGCEAWPVARDIYTGYEKFFKPALTVIHYLEMGAGYGYPYLGAVKGYQMGTNYSNQSHVEGVTVIPVSPSMVPGFVYGGSKTGLPVQAMAYDFLCQKLASVIVDFGKSIAKPSLGLIGEIVHAVSCIFGCESIDDIFKSILGAGVKFRYCNSLGSNMANGINGAMEGLGTQLGRGQEKVDGINAQRAQDNQNLPQGETAKPMIKDPNVRAGTGGGVGGFGGWQSVLDPGFDRGWGNDGPYVVMFGADNGNDWFQVWSINIAPQYTDTNERKIMIASRQQGVDVKQGPRLNTTFLGNTIDAPLGYFAQAEFYFDCENKFGADDCNGGSFDNSSLFAIKWRARMHKLQLPDIGALLQNGFLDNIMNSDGYNDVREVLTTSNPVFEALQTGPLSALGIGQLRNQINYFITKFEGGLYGAGTPGSVQGSFH